MPDCPECGRELEEGRVGSARAYFLRTCPNCGYSESYKPSELDASDRETE